MLIKLECFLFGALFPELLRNVAALTGLSFQALLKSGPRQRECDPSQQPGQVCIPDPHLVLQNPRHFALST